MLAASENNAISDDDPNDYLPRLAVELGDDVDAVFGSNYMPLTSTVDYAGLDYPSFIEARAALLLADINKLANGESI